MDAPLSFIRLETIVCWRRSNDLQTFVQMADAVSGSVHSDTEVFLSRSVMLPKSEEALMGMPPAPTR